MAVITHTDTKEIQVKFNSIGLHSYTHQMRQEEEEERCVT